MNPVACWLPPAAALLYEQGLQLRRYLWQP